MLVIEDIQAVLRRFEVRSVFGFSVGRVSQKYKVVGLQLARGSKDTPPPQPYPAFLPLPYFVFDTLHLPPTQQHFEDLENNYLYPNKHCTSAGIKKS